jgi:hypothetical protein
MSNINAKNIISENITVTNLNVTYINGAPYVPNPCNNPCNKGGYYVACPDCDYAGPDDCDCGNTCYCTSNNLQSKTSTSCGCNRDLPETEASFNALFAPAAFKRSQAMSIPVFEPLITS